jgi:hypothetical protein
MMRRAFSERGRIVMLIGSGEASATVCASPSGVTFMS